MNLIIDIINIQKPISNVVGSLDSPINLLMSFISFLLNLSLIFILYFSLPIIRNYFNSKKVRQTWIRNLNEDYVIAKTDEDYKEMLYKQSPIGLITGILVGYALSFLLLIIFQKEFSNLSSYLLTLFVMSLSSMLLVISLHKYKKSKTNKNKCISNLSAIVTFNNFVKWYIILFIILLFYFPVIYISQKPPYNNYLIIIFYSVIWFITLLTILGYNEYKSQFSDIIKTMLNCRRSKYYPYVYINTINNNVVKGNLINFFDRDFITLNDGEKKKTVMWDSIETMDTISNHLENIPIFNIRPNQLTWIIVFVILPSILISVYSLPTFIKDIYFALNPQNLVISSIYLSAYIHFDLFHLLSNLIIYLVIMFLILNFTTNKKHFNWNILSIFIDVPIITSLAYLYLIDLQLISYGFSSIVSALIGFFLYTVYSYLKNSYQSLDYNFIWLILLINFFLISIYLNVGHLLMAFIFMMVVILVYLNKTFIKEQVNNLKGLGAIRKKSKELDTLRFEYYVLLITLAIVFLFPFYIIVPPDPTQGDFIANSLSHYIGYIYGIITPIVIGKLSTDNS
jgi:hypothetical protein